jgi:hypothetical protein
MPHLAYFKGPELLKETRQACDLPEPLGAQRPLGVNIPVHGVGMTDQI